MFIKNFSRLFLTGFILLIFSGLSYAQQKPEFVSVVGKLERITPPINQIDKTTTYGKPLVITRVRDGFAKGIPSPEEAEEKLTHRKKYPSNNEKTREELVRKAIEANNNATLNTPVSITNVNIDGQTATGFAPSDNNLAVGPNHVIQIINHSSGSLFKVWNKAGTVVQASTILSTITGLTGAGDPVVLYDQLADRWLLSEFGPSSCCNKLIIAVSATSDPTGSWYIYSYTDPAFFPDYPKYAVWHNAYYATTNDFNTAGTAYLGSSIWAFNRAAMIAGNPTATMIRSRLNNANFDFYSMAPVCQEGPAVSNQSGMFSYLFENSDTGDPTDLDRIYLFEFTPDFVTPANSVIGPTTSMAATVPFNIAANNASQLGSTNTIDVLNYRLYHKIIYRNYGSSESIVCCSVDGVAAGRTGIHWWELRRPGSGSWSIFQEGVYAPNTVGSLHRYLGSIAINANRDIGLLFNISGTALYPSLRFTARNECDPPGTMTLPETVIKDGTTFQSGHTRYGDYNTLTIDPSNGSFWGTGQYTAPGFGTYGNWATRIVNFSLTSCSACTPPTINAPTITQPTCALPTGTIVVNATGTGALEYSIDNGANWQISATFGSLVPGNYNIKVRLEASPACISTYGSNPVVIISSPLPPAPFISPNGPIIFCSGGSVNLSAVTSFPYYLKLSIPVAHSFSIGTASFGPPVSTTPVNGNFVYIPDGTSSYLGCSAYTPGSLTGKVALIDRGNCLFTIKVKNAQDAGAIGVIIINNNALGPVNMGGTDPTITIPSISVSQSDGLLLKNLITQGTVTGSTLAHSFSYLWSNGAITPAIPVSESGIFTVQVTDENGCSGTSAPITITVNPIPDAVATPSSQTICSGSAITTIVNSGSVAGTVYEWTRDNTVSVTGMASSGTGDISGLLTNTTNTPITVTFTITPGYTNAGVTCTGAAITATVVVNPIPDAIATPSSQTICSGSAITTIVNSGNVSGTVYNWTRDNLTITGIAANGTGDISGSLTNSTTAPVTVTFTITPGYTYAGVTCTGTPVTATVIVNPLTAISANPVNQTIIALNSTSFSVTATGTAPLTYKWQESIDGGATFYDLTDGGVYSGTGTNILNLTVVPVTMNGYKYRCVVSGACSTATSTAATLVIERRPTVITYTGDNSEQYSDQQTLTAVLKDQATNAVLTSKTVTFTIGIQSVSDGPGAPGFGTDGSGIASGVLTLYQNIGPYNVVSSFEGDAAYAPSSDTDPFRITKENAIADYTGPEFISVPCASCATTNVLLSASIRDTTAAYPLNDTKPGDIRKARVRFVDLNTNAPISGWLTPGLVNAADTTRGIINYNWTVSVPTTGYDVYSIGVIVDSIPSTLTGNYIGKTETVVSISRSSLAEFITGGGNVIPTSSDGQYASDAGRKLNFGFNVKYNKSNTNLKGNMNIIFRRGAKVYQIKATSITSLSINSINPCSKKAVFTSKANLQDVTNPNISPVGVLGGLTLQTTMTDNGEPGNNDRIGVTLWDGNTLVYSSNWVTTQTIELQLNGGNLQVHNGVNCTITTKEVQPVTATKEVQFAPSLISIKVYPNPLSAYTIIRYVLPVETHVSLSVYDHLGQKVAQLAEGNRSAGEHQARFDATKLAAGIYLYTLNAVDAEGKPVVLTGKMTVAR